MTEEQALVHKKLTDTLPVRTHLSVDDGTPCRYLGQGYKHGKHSKKKRAVIVKGKKYQSITLAARAIGRSRQLVYQWVMKGKDCYYVE